MKLVKTIDVDPAARPPCEATVRVAEGMGTRTAQHRQYLATRRKLPVDQCGARAMFEIGGVKMCRPHAGAAALEILMEGDEN